MCFAVNESSLRMAFLRTGTSCLTFLILPLFNASVRYLLIVEVGSPGLNAAPNVPDLGATFSLGGSIVASCSGDAETSACGCVSTLPCSLSNLAWITLRSCSVTSYVPPSSAYWSTLVISSSCSNFSISILRAVLFSSLRRSSSIALAFSPLPTSNFTRAFSISALSSGSTPSNAAVMLSNDRLTKSASANGTL